MRIQALLLCSLSPFLLFPLPRNPQLMHGSAAFEQTDRAISINASDKTILHWSEFSIEEGETARFVLPTADSSLLNRVMEAYPSRLLGKLEANGRILLINPNGVLVGADAQIDTGSFIASSLDVLDSAFLDASDLAFSGPSDAPIANTGKITSEGEIFLIGRRVENHGSLKAGREAGAVAASAILLKPKNLPGVSIRADGPSPDADNFFSYAFHQSESGNGPTETHVSGQIRAPRIAILGDEIQLQAHSLIDASMDFGGGTVLIGGGLQGKNPLIANALRTYIDPDALVLADALQSGGGGSIIAWGDREVSVLGALAARGGREGGNGGFVEVSTKDRMAFAWHVDIGAPRGKSGTLLLDPTNITISGAPTTGGVSLATNPATLPASTPVNILNTDLSTFLNTMGSVAITTTVLPDQGAAGDISVSANVAWDSANSLSLTAANNIDVSANIQNGGVVGTGAVTLSAGGAISLSGLLLDCSVGAQNAPTTVSCPGDLSLQGGTLHSAQIGFRTAPAPLTCTNAPIQVSCNNLTLLAGPSLGGAMIGHGIADTGGANDMSTVNCPITVSVAGDAFLSGGTNASMAKIGHGSYALGSAMMNDLDGDISVFAAGSLTLNGGLGASINGALIGHGSGTPAVMQLGNLVGNITVEVGEDLILQSLTGNNNRAAIGHYTHLNDPAAIINDVFGDVTITCGGDCILNGDGATNHIFIGHHATLGFTGDYISNLHLTVHGDLSMTNQGDSQGAIGWSRFQVAIVSEPNIIGEVAVAVSGNLTMTGNTGSLASPNIRNVIIGYQTNDTASMPIPNPPTSVAVGGNILLDNRGAAGNGRYHLGIGGYGDVFVSAGGDITVLGSQSLSTMRTYIGSIRLNNNVASAPLTRIFAAGNILSTNRTGEALLGFSDWLNSTVANYGFSSDIRSGGDIQVSTDIITNFNGSLFLQADSPFSAGELWGYAGANLVSVAGTPLLAPVSNTSVLTGPVSANSAPLGVNALGGLRFNPSPFAGNVDLQTFNGSITLHSASFRQNGAVQNLTVGTGATDAGISTTNGNIEIWGSVPGDAYNNIFFNHPNTMMNTTGSILAVANTNMTVEAGIQIQSTANFVTLVVDNFFPAPPLIGPGQFIANTGAILNSGPNSPLRVFTARQQINLIDPSVLFNNTLFSPGLLFLNTNQEIWCAYFDTPIQGIPFTIFYKDCLQTVLEQAMDVVDELLVSLHPYNEFPGWEAQFWMNYMSGAEPKHSLSSLSASSNEPYLIRRRLLNSINHPKSYTQLLPE